jgi:hypothetical protein
MRIDLDRGDPKSGVLALVLALVEIIKETLEAQALKRIESGRLTDGEMERLGLALRDLSAAIDKIEAECGAADSVRAVRDALDETVDEVLDQFVNPDRWKETRAAGEARSLEAI